MKNRRKLDKVFGFSMKKFRKNKEKKTKSFQKKLLKRWDIDPKTHPLFISQIKDVDPEKLKEIIDDARKREKRRYIKKVNKFLEEDENNA